MRSGLVATWTRDATWTQFLDFKHQEVRDERFALIQETLNNYEIDGFELQLLYGQAYFHPKELEAGRTIMTQWVRQVYEAVKKSGAERELVLRVPTSVEAALAIGLDLREWVNQGIVDVLVGEEVDKSGVSDPSADFRELVDVAKGSECRVHAAVYSHLDSDRLNEATIEMIRAAACNYWEQGIDGVYMPGWFSQWPYKAPFYEKLRELPHPDVMAPKDKIYHVPTETGRVPHPAAPAGATTKLPVELEVGTPSNMQFTISDDLPRWADVGRVHEVLLRVRVLNTTELDRLSFTLNGRELPDELLRKINRMYLMDAPRFRVFGYWYVFRLNRDHWPVTGANELEVALLARDPDITPQIAVRDVELDIKYLMGKNYHRGFVDADLGPYAREVE